MIKIRETWEIERMQISSQIVRDTLNILSELVRPGISTLELDVVAEDFIKSQDAIPGFKGLYGFPSTVCASVDDEVVHGVPNNVELEEGQILSLDVGAVYKGYLLNEMRHGPGVQVWPDNAKYEGEWRENKANGRQQATP